MDLSAGSPSKGTHETRKALTSSAVHPDDRSADSRLLKVGFGLYLETRGDDDVAGSGLSTAGHPIFEYLFPRSYGDS